MKLDSNTFLILNERFFNEHKNLIFCRQNHLNPLQKSDGIRGGFYTVEKNWGTRNNPPAPHKEVSDAVSNKENTKHKI